MYNFNWFQQDTIYVLQAIAKQKTIYCQSISLALPRSCDWVVLYFAPFVISFDIGDCAVTVARWLSCCYMEKQGNPTLNARFLWNFQHEMKFKKKKALWIGNPLASRTAVTLDTQTHTHTVSEQLELSINPVNAITTEILKDYACFSKRKQQKTEQ